MILKVNFLPIFSIILMITYKDLEKLLKPI